MTPAASAAWSCRAASSIDSTGSIAYVASAGDGTQPGGLAALAINESATLTPGAYITTFDGMATVDVTLGNGPNTFTVESPATQTNSKGKQVSISELDINAGSVDSVVALNALNPTTSVWFNGGNNTFLLNAPQTGATLAVHTGPGNNQVNLAQVSKNSTVTVGGGMGNDQFNVGTVSSGANLTITSGKGTNDFHVAGTGIASTAGVTLTANSSGDNTLVFDPGYPAGSLSGTALNAQGNPKTGNGPYTLNVGSSGTLTYANFDTAYLLSAPVITAASTFSGTEGQPVTLTGTVAPLGSEDALSGTVSWDINGDGIFGDIPGSVTVNGNVVTASVTASWAQLAALGMGSFGTYQVGLLATNTDGLSTELYVPLVMADVAPGMTLNTPGTVTDGNASLLNGTVSTVNVQNPTTVTVNWGDESHADHDRPRGRRDVVRALAPVSTGRHGGSRHRQSYHGIGQRRRDGQQQCHRNRDDPQFNAHDLRVEFRQRGDQ